MKLLLCCCRCELRVPSALLLSAPSCRRGGSVWLLLLPVVTLLCKSPSPLAYLCLPSTEARAPFPPQQQPLCSCSHHSREPR